MLKNEEKIRTLARERFYWLFIFSEKHNKYRKIYFDSEVYVEPIDVILQNLFILRYSVANIVMYTAESIKCLKVKKYTKLISCEKSTLQSKANFYTQSINYRKYKSQIKSVFVVNLIYTILGLQFCL